MSASASSQEGAILSRVVRDVPPAVARWLLGLDFDPADRERIAVLSEKGRAGTLSEAEDAELEGYGEVGHLLEILRSKARASLGSEVSETVKEEPLAYGGIIVADPPPAR